MKCPLYSSEGRETRKTLALPFRNKTPRQAKTGWCLACVRFGRDRKFHRQGINDVTVFWEMDLPSLKPDRGVRGAIENSSGSRLISGASAYIEKPRMQFAECLQVRNRAVGGTMCTLFGSHFASFASQCGFSWSWFACEQTREALKAPPRKARADFSVHAC